VKSYAVSVDGATFTGGVPASLSTISTIENLGLDVTLIHCAIWNTIPCLRISSYCSWAVLRYCHLFQPGPQLRLVSAWADADFHQKLCLSEDFAVGAVANLLCEKSDFRELSFVSYVVRRGFPIETLTGTSSIPRGQKTADYICTLGGSGGFAVLECKGTQEPLSRLRAALKRGITQKKGTRSLFGHRFAMSLVAGVKIPTARSRQGAHIVICDPPSNAIAESLASVSDDELKLRILCGSLAAQLRTAGAPHAADHIASRVPTALGSEARREIAEWTADRLVVRMTDYVMNRRSVAEVVVTANISDRLRAALLSNSPLDVVASLEAGKWKHVSGSNESTVLTPLGVSITLMAPLASSQDDGSDARLESS
jgi:hypothetical protein